MKTFFIVAIIGILFISCKKNYELKIEGVNVQGNEVYEDFSGSTEFLDEQVLLSAIFQLNPSHAKQYSRLGEITILNPVVENNISLTSNQVIISNTDTFSIGENLISNFEFIRHQKLFALSYNFRFQKAILNETGFYTFYLDFKLEDGTSVNDSCRVKINL